MAESVYQRVAAVLADLPAVGKDASNSGLGFAYRSHDAILNAVHPLLAKHGLVLSPEVVSHTYEPLTKGWVATVLVKYHAIAEDGSRCELGSAPGTGHDTFDKAMTKAMTYAFKTFLGQVFAIATEDDPDGAAPDVGGKKPAAAEQSMSQGHLLAQAAARAGFRAAKDGDAEARKKIDEARRDVLQAVTGVRSSKEITKAHDVKKALDAFEAIAAGRLELAYEPDGTPILQAKPAPPAGGCAHPWPWRKTGRCVYCPSCGERLYQGDLPKNAEEAGATLAVLDAAAAKAASS
jgi:hypothetical protein